MSPTTAEYDLKGDGDDVILFIHGHPFNHTMWRGQVEAAAAVGWKAVAPDLRGYGSNPPRPGRFTLDDFALDLAGLLEELGVERVVLCGLSMGGQIAMAFADRFPDRTRGLILAATFARAETADGRLERLRVADRIEREGMGELAVELLPMMLAAETRRSRPDLAREVQTMMSATAPQGAAAALRGRADRPDYISTLRRFHGPALIVAGDQDAYTTQADVDAMSSALSASEVLWLPGIGHMPNLEAPEIFNAGLTSFLERVGTGGGR